MTHDAAEGALVVFTTAPSRDEAGALAEMLVERRLAACVQIVPGVESVYRWNDAISRDAEWLLLCKTTRSSYEGLERALLQAHSYDTPEIVALAVERGSASYLDWLVAETGRG